ncbi:hypothetical protein AB5I41_02790 [Sphingomonas sp. MMS24-JH45]
MRLRLYTIPSHRAFADALVAGLLRRTGEDRLALARGVVLVPNNRGGLAVRDAFVRASGGALLLPRIVALGQDDLAGERAAGRRSTPRTRSRPLPLRCRRCVAAWYWRGLSRKSAPPPAPGRRGGGGAAGGGAGADAGPAGAGGRRAVPAGGHRSGRRDCPNIGKARCGCSASCSTAGRRSAPALGGMDAAERRMLLLRRQAERWRADPPAGLVCAAGVTDSARGRAAVARRVGVAGDDGFRRARRGNAGRRRSGTR